MITIKSLKTMENKVMAVFIKDESFFSLFSKFMLNCGIEWEHNENREGLVNRIESYKNNDYDIDLCFSNEIVFVVIRTENIKGVKSWMSNNSSWQVLKPKN